jgi:NADPH-dependent 2,4-dienoyl-CoA reductase/sulfur reductase-like enzyme
MDEDQVDGLQRADALEAMRHYVTDGIDFLSVIRGTIESDASLSKVIPSMGTTSAPHLDFAGEIKRAVDVPVMHAARISDVATARYAIREGLVDLVGMTRAQIADPHLVRKIAAGDEDRIRPCVGANFCLDSIYQSGDAKCIHNPATGRELTLPHVIQPSDEARKVLVIGAGPAGLEAARVLGERGHRVVVMEAAHAPGGQVRLAAAAARRRDLIGIIDWRLAEAKRNAVDFRYGVLADADIVRAERPDVVVIATGGLPNRGFLTGAELVLDTWDVMGGAAHPHGSVLVYDDNGAEPAMDAAELLATRGASVELVTPERTLAPLVGSMNSPAYLRAFAEQAVSVTLGYRLLAVTVDQQGGRVAHLRSEYADVDVERHVDHVVVEHGTLPNDDLYFDLVPFSRNLGAVDHTQLLNVQPQSVTRNPDGDYDLYRIGDAVSSRNIHAAMYDALRLCVAI